MKKYTLPVRGVDRNMFDFIKSGKKKIETRAGGPKYDDIQNGDVVVVKCGGDSFERIVRNVEHFKSVDDILKVYKASDINPSLKTSEELKKMYSSYPNYDERIKKYGLIAFGLK